ncbi:MAG TPA: PAS domain S-box protein [Caldithrix abyssi]|uniref:histidine kinase n=1 Tax=Caldithrix abyssi TaxID=187145 RepID=A0A7V4TY41_CALAY|nr:PAS domain S-box protein [Caldithrix abyssi]
MKKSNEEVLREEIEALKRENSNLKKQVENIKNSEAFYKAIFNFSPSGILVEDENGIVLDANPAFCRTYGYPKKELVGKSVQVVTHHENSGLIKKNIHRILEGKQLQFVVKSCKKDGSTIFTELNERSIRLPNGRTGIISISFNKTEHIRTQEALKNSEREFRNLLKLLPYGVIIYNLEGRIVYGNREVKRIFKHDKNKHTDFLGISVFDFLHNEEVEKVKHRFQGLLKGKKQPPTIEKVYDFEGNLIEVEVVSRRTIFNGKPALLAIVIDVSERIKSEKELKQRERYFRRLFEYAPYPELILIEEKIAAINRAALKFFGVKNANELKGIPLKNMVSSKTPLGKLDTDEGKETLTYNNIRIKPKHKKERVANITVTRTYFAGRSAVHVTLHDLTELYQTLDKLRESEETYRELFDKSSEAIYVQDKDGVFLDVNRGVLNMYGYPKKFFIGNTPAPLSAPGLNDMEKVVNHLKKAFAGEPQQFEFWGIRRNGEVFPKIVRLNRGKYFGKDVIFAFAMDISEQKVTEQALKNTNKTLELMNAVSKVGISSRSPEDLAEKLARELRKALPVDAFILDGFYPGTNSYYGFGNFDTINGRFQKVREFQQGFDWTKSKKRKKLFEEKKPILILRHRGQINQITASRQRKGIKEKPSVSLIYVPLILSNKVTGVLSIQSYEYKAYTQEDVRLLTHIGRQIAPAVESLLLNKELMEQAIKLRENERRYRLLFDHAMDYILIIDPFHPQGPTVVDANEAAFKKHGYSREEFIGFPLSAIDSPENQKVMQERLQKILSKETIVFETRHTRKDGSTFPVEVKAQLIHLQGKPYIYAMERDISERKKAEQNIHRLATVVEQSVEAIEITDIDGNIQYVNKALEEMSGYNRSELIGQNARIHKSGKHNLNFYQELWKTILRGKKWQGIIINKRKNGNIYYEKAVIFPIKDASGKIIQFASVRRDITLERQLEQQLQQMQKMEAIGTLTGGIAHDFNNLLTVINGHAEIGLMRVEETDQVHNDLLSILNAGKKAERLTSQLLAFSRRQIHELKILQINELIRDLEKMLQRLIPEDISITTQLGEDLPYIKADPAQIEQILINLVVNARDALQEQTVESYKKQIMIKTETQDIDDYLVKERVGIQSGVYIVISVSDSGVGIEEDIKDRIFEPFFTTKEVNKGTGLGLATVYGIVKQNNGYIFVESEKGQGSTFFVYWPVTSEEPQTELAQKIAEENLEGRETILFIEDDESVRQFACQALRTFGYTIIEALNGKNALKLIEREKPRIDFAITDLIMPEMDGRAVGQELQKLFPNIKTLYVSGYAHDHLVKDGALEPGINFLQKPYSIQQLLKMIRKMLDARTG